jgi:hypothetical protein
MAKPLIFSMPTEPRSGIKIEASGSQWIPIGRATGHDLDSALYISNRISHFSARKKQQNEVIPKEKEKF